MVLVDMIAGESAIIKDFSNITDMVKRRLLDLGISEGVEVCLKCHMPFGGPYMIEHQGQNIGIRKNEANLIRVERI